MNSTPAVAVVISEPLREQQGGHQIADQPDREDGTDHIHPRHSLSTARTSRPRTTNATTVSSRKIRSDTRTSEGPARPGIGRRSPYKPRIRGWTVVFTKYLRSRDGISRFLYGGPRCSGVGSMS